MPFDPVTVGGGVVVVRLSCGPWQLLSDCQSSSAAIYSGSEAKNKQNRVKCVLGSERCLIFESGSAKNILCVLGNTLCVFAFVCVCVCDCDCLL